MVANKSMVLRGYKKMTCAPLSPGKTKEYVINSIIGDGFLLQSQISMARA